MMGAVNCSRHGLQIESGPPSCKHVLAAVKSEGEPVEPTVIQVDFLSDGSMIWDYLLCTECVRRYAIPTAEVISGEVVEDEERFPWVAPVCPVCLAEFNRSRAAQPT